MISPTIVRRTAHSIRVAFTYRRSSSPSCQQGFTLIELMIGLAILGILVTIGLPYYGDYRDRTAVGDAYALMKEIRMQVSEQYIWDKTLPDAVEDYSALIPPNSDLSDLYYDGSDDNNQIVAKFGAAAGSTLHNRELWLELDTSEAGKLAWTCKTPAVATAQIPDSALPALCR